MVCRLGECLHGLFVDDAAGDVDVGVLLGPSGERLREQYFLVTCVGLQVVQGRDRSAERGRREGIGPGGAAPSPTVKKTSGVMIAVAIAVTSTRTMPFTG